MMDPWEHPIFGQTLQEWQGIVDLVVRLVGARAGLIMRARGDDIAVLVASCNPGNPYEVGEKEKLVGSGLYCERVIATQEKLLVPNALKSDEWRNNPDIKRNMISYLGFPIRLPGGQPFGTICVLDDRESQYSSDVIELMEKMRDLIESHLQLNERLLLQENVRLFEQLQDELAERARVEAELRASQQKYRMLTENMQDVVWILDPLADRFLYVSPSVQALRGYTAEEVMAQPASAALTEESAGRVKTLMAQGYASFRAGRRTTDRYDISELEQPCKDGSTVWTEAVTHYVLDEATGRVIVHGVTRDITERKRAEEALRASEERYRLLLMLLPDGVSVVDQAGAILACNEQFARMFGYDSVADLIGRNARELSRPEAFAGLYREVAAAFARGESVARDIEVEVLRRDGTAFWTEYSVAPMSWPDAPSDVAYISNIRDITTRKALAAELKQHQLYLEELVQERTRDLQTEIARRTAAQSALARSEASLKAAERIAHVGSWERDLATNEYLWSDEICRIFGVTPEDPLVTRAGIWRAIHPDDVAAVEAAYAHALRTGEKLDHIYRVLQPGGETRVVHGIAEVICDETGQPQRVRGMVQDITEQERVRQALAQRVKELSILQGMGHVVSFNLPLEEIIQTYLQRLVALTELDMAQVFLWQGDRLRLMGVCTDLPQPFTPVQVLAAGECLCGLAMQEGRTLYTAEIEADPRCTLPHCHAPCLRSLAALPLRNGEAAIGVLAVAATAPDAFAGRLGFLETIADLLGARLQNALLHQQTRERAAGLEEAVAERTLELQTERNRTQAILETVGESVIVTDLDGQMLFSNPATESLIGFWRDEILGQPIWRQWSAQARKEIWPQARQALGGGQPWRGEVTGQRKDGARYVAALTGAPLYDERAAPQVTGAVWVQRDITSLKEAERLKDQFVSNVSHELRTPISIIALSCDNLDTFYDRLGDAQRRQLLRDIREQARLLGNLVEDILTVSRIDSGRVSLAKIPLDLARLAGEEVARQRSLAVERSQQLTFTVKTPPVTLGNEVQLQRVVRNLLDNAIKFTPTGGQIRCTCDVRSGVHAGGPDTAALPSATWAVVEIADDGIGIPADALPFLFERFYRVNVEWEVAGAGLGLPIARELVTLHGGWIDVTSAPGQGSTFTVFLPLLEEGMA